MMKVPSIVQGGGFSQQQRLRSEPCYELQSRQERYRQTHPATTHLNDTDTTKSNLYVVKLYK